MLSLPIVLLLGIFFVWPLLDVLLRSLNAHGLVSYAQPQFTLVNYEAIFRKKVLLVIIWQTVQIAFWATLFTTLLAFPTAYLFSRLSRRAAAIFIGLILMPFWVSIVVRLFALTAILSGNGIVNSAARLVQLGPFDLIFNTTGTVIGMVNYLLPYLILILYAGMVGIDGNLIAAAKTLGARPWKAFVEIYMPLVRPTLLSGILLIFVISLSFFLTPAVLGGPQDMTVAVYIEQQVNIYSWGVASAIAIVLLVSTVVGYAAVLRLSGAVPVAGVGVVAGKGISDHGPLRMSPLAVLLWLAAGASFITLFLPMVLVFPMSIGTTQNVLFPPQGFTLDWYARVFEDTTWTDPILKSVTVGVGTAILSTSIALAFARVVAAIRSSTLRSIAYAAVFAPLITPAILLAIGEYDVQTRLNLTGSTVGLIFAHSTIALPLAFAIISNALLNIDGALEPAAWTLGASRTRAFWAIVARAIAPSIGGAFVVSFMTSWDEVIIALFQAGFSKTLPLTIYSYLQSGIVPTVPAVASMLVALIVVGTIATWIVVGRISSRSASGRHSAEWTA
ncbi:MAG TPA: ABC transporter permease subunit [Galbitalea sp.]